MLEGKLFLSWIAKKVLKVHCFVCALQYLHTSNWS